MLAAPAGARGQCSGIRRGGPGSPSAGLRPARSHSRRCLRSSSSAVRAGIVTSCCRRSQIRLRSG